MSRVDELLARYMAAFEAGDAPDPREYLDAAGDRRAALEAALERYLREAPRRPFDAAAFATSRAAPVGTGLEHSLGGASGLWPSLLPRLRARAQLRRADLVGRLAAALGAEAHTTRVGAYYHEMEQGRLPAAGVSERVLEALAAIIGESAARLRAAGGEGGHGVAASGPAAGAFARTGAATADRLPEGTEEGAPADVSPPWDEVDRLFRGG